MSSVCSDTITQQSETFYDAINIPFNQNPYKTK